MWNWLLSLLYPDLDKLFVSLGKLIARLEAYAKRKAAEVDVHLDLAKEHESKAAMKQALIARADRVQGKLEELLR